MTAFRTSLDGVAMVLRSGREITLDRECADHWLELHRLAHDCAMRDGDIEAARDIRKDILDLDLALNPPLPKIPTLQPLTCVVRELDPEVWKVG
jgi:hypothetical protein